METGIELIAAERQRQIDVEGYKDDSHYKKGELFDAALCYYYAEAWRKTGYGSKPEEFPFDKKYWKPVPNDRIRELTKAGALFKADFDATGHPLSLIWMKRCAVKIDEHLTQA